MKNFKVQSLHICLFIFLFIITILSNISCSGTISKSNVLLIIADDLRPSLGCYGGHALTPNIDNLARQGIVFRNAFAQQALCGPSRTSLLTSRRPDITGIISNGRWRRKHGKNFTTLPQFFKEHGYHSVSIGKIFHPGGISPKSNISDDYPASWSEVPYHPPSEIYKNAKVCQSADTTLHKNLICPVDVDKQPDKTLPDIQSADYAVNFFKTYSRSKPFFLAVGFHKPHIPLKYPRKYLDLYPLSKINLAPDPYRSPLLPNIAWNPWTDIRSRDDMAKLNISFPYGPIPQIIQKRIRQSYFAATSYMDDQVGRILSQLEESNFAQNTIICLIGDHGWSLGEHGEWSKFSNFETSVNVPLIIYDPKTFEHNRVNRMFEHIGSSLRFKTASSYQIKSSDSLVELVDVFPTLADIAGLPVPKLCPRGRNTPTCSEGLSFFPLMKSVNFGSIRNWKSAVFSQYPRPSIVPEMDSDQPRPSKIKYMGYSMRTKRYRYTQWMKYDPSVFKPNWNEIISTELYDHKYDSLEDNNVALNVTYAHHVKELAKNLKKGWRHALPL